MALDLAGMKVYIAAMKHTTVLKSGKRYAQALSIAAAATLSLTIFHAFPALAPAASSGPEPRTSWQQPVKPDDNPQAAILEAEKRFQQSEENFKAAEKPDAKAGQKESQKNSQRPASEVQKNQPDPARRSQQSVDPRSEAMQGTPQTGYSGTWNDPATGDIITSVIAPAPSASSGQAQNYPIIIEPQVVGSDYYGSSYGYGAQASWPQWPGYPGDSGYPPQSQQQPPPSAPYPYPPQPMPSPGFAPSDQPPPFPPGYRPLRPTPPGQGWNQGNNPGFNPALPGNPGFNPQVPYPGQPGNPAAPPGPGFNPGVPNYPGYLHQVNPGMPNNPGSSGFSPQPGIPGYIPPANQEFNPGAPGGIGSPPPPFPVGPANPGLQPAPGPLINGPGPGFRPMPMMPGGNGMPGGRR